VLTVTPVSIFKGQQKNKRQSVAQFFFLARNANAVERKIIGCRNKNLLNLFCLYNIPVFLF